MDDVVLGAKTAELAYKLCVHSRNLLRDGGFNLRKFLTDNEWLQERISDGKSGKEGRQLETYINIRRISANIMWRKKGTGSAMGHSF